MQYNLYEVTWYVKNYNNINYETKLLFHLAQIISKKKSHYSLDTKWGLLETLCGNFQHLEAVLGNICCILDIVKLEHLMLKKLFQNNQCSTLLICIWILFPFHLTFLETDWFMKSSVHI